MKPFWLICACLAGVVALTGCKTPEEKQEEVERERRLHERLDDIQQQLLALQEGQRKLEAARAEPAPSLRPVVPVKTVKLAPKPRVTLRSRLHSLPQRYKLKPVTKAKSPAGGRKTRARKKESYASLRRRYIRVGVPVRVIQQALANAGCSPGKIDGRVGPKTIEAIRKFQKQQGLPVDGIVGPKTWARLRNAGG